MLKARHILVPRTKNSEWKNCLIFSFTISLITFALMAHSSGMSTGIVCVQSVALVEPQTVTCRIGRALGNKVHVGVYIECTVSWKNICTYICWFIFFHICHNSHASDNQANFNIRQELYHFSVLIFPLSLFFIVLFFHLESCTQFP